MDRIWNQHLEPPEVSKPSHHFVATWNWLGRPKPSEGQLKAMMRNGVQRWIVGMPLEDILNKV